MTETLKLWNLPHDKGKAGGTVAVWAKGEPPARRLPGENMPKSIYDILGDRVREERKKAGLTIERLAGLAGISPSFLAYIETKGRRPALILYKNWRKP